MKIDGSGSELQSKLSVYKTTHLQGHGQDEAKSEQRETPTVQEDRVDFSARGRLMAEAQKAIASVPDVRELLVSQIKTDVENGTYRVDSQKTASGMLREALTNQAAMRPQ